MFPVGFTSTTASVGASVAFGVGPHASETMSTNMPNQKKDGKISLPLNSPEK
jgi:hypothetical protein